jgi:hypothetical protein
MVARFVTCLGCGMSIDAAPRDRQVPVRHARLPADSDDDAHAAPHDWLGRALPWRLVVAVALLIAGVAYVMTGYFVSRRHRETRSEYERIERAHREPAHDGSGPR